MTQNPIADQYAVSSACDGIGQPEISHVQRAAAVGAVERQQPGFQCNEGDGVIRFDRAAQHAASVGVEAAGNVERQYRRLDIVDLFDQRGVIAGKVALQADAEQAVDDQRPALRCRNMRRALAAGRFPVAQGCSRFAGVFCGAARADHADRVPPLPEVLRDHQRIAAVVAGTGKHKNGLAAVAGEGAGQFGGGQSGAGHQRGRMTAFERDLFDFTQFGGQQYRCGMGQIHHEGNFNAWRSAACIRFRVKSRFTITCSSCRNSSSSEDATPSRHSVEKNCCRLHLQTFQVCRSMPNSGISSI